MTDEKITFLWHDYETWGTNPATDRPAQFAGIRTNLDFERIGDPINLFAIPSNDFLPQPEACLITGLSPQEVSRKGINEANFFQLIFNEMVKPSTCSLGYNSIQFDDEVSRYGFYRNFFDPYEREWKNGNSRWDIINLFRLANAIRPDGISWPKNSIGHTSFRLEDLAYENDIAHSSAHDALSDVETTIELAKLIKKAQPKLFDYVFKHRSKKEILKLLNNEDLTPVLHVSPIYTSELGCIASVVPIINHPKNGNSIIVIDLRYDPDYLLKLGMKEIQDIFLKKDSENLEKRRNLGIGQISVNKAPVIVPITTINSAQREKWSMSEIEEKRNLSIVKNNFSELSAKLNTLFEEYLKFSNKSEVDNSLYDGFISDNDKRVSEIIRKSEPEELSKLNLNFESNKLSELFFRYRARNYFDTLSTFEKKIWDDFRKKRLISDSKELSLNINEYQKKISDLLKDPNIVKNRKDLLDELLLWPDLIGLK